MDYRPLFSAPNPSGTSRVRQVNLPPPKDGDEAIGLPSDIDNGSMSEREGKVSMRETRRLLKSKRRETGAALVEMAVVAPFLLLLLLGIVEFGWLLGQYNDVRHGAREGARFAAVDGGDVVGHVCSAMEGLNAGMTSIQVSLSRDGDEIGNKGEITVQANVTSLSSAPLISNLLPTSLASTVEFRLEQPASWGSGGQCDDG